MVNDSFDPNPNGSNDFPAVFGGFFKILSFILGWLIFPFIPLFLTVHHPVLFYGILVSYIVFFLILNRVKMHYPWTETIVFILIFLFGVFLFKSLIDYDVIGEKQTVKTAITLGTPPL